MSLGDVMQNRLKELRKIHGLRQIDFAKVLGISQSTLSTWESGRYEPDAESLVRIAAYFNVTTDYLLGRDDSIKKEPATNNGDGLDDEKLKLLVDLFQSAPEYLQDAALAVLRSEAARQQDKDKP